MNPVLRAGTASLLTVVFSSMSIMTGCKSAEPTPQQSQAAAPAPSAPASPPPQQISVDDLVAPIALYPDQLLAQILTASTNAQEVLDGGNWLLQNQNLKGDALTNAAKQAGFSPSMQYLMSFPQVVDNMCQQLDWTRELGQNFQADQKGVMDAVQRKRAQAQQTGNLKSSPQMKVETKKAENGQPYVEITAGKSTGSLCSAVQSRDHLQHTGSHNRGGYTARRRPRKCNPGSAPVLRSLSDFSRSVLAWLSVRRSTATTTIHTPLGDMVAFIMVAVPTIRLRTVPFTRDIAQPTDIILRRTTTGTSTTKTSTLP